MPKLTIRPGKKTVAPLQVKDKKLINIGVYPRKNPMGWSRLYMHLWHQAGIELKNKLEGLEPTAVNNEKEKWVLNTCKIIGLDYYKFFTNRKKEEKEKAKKIRINPSVISYDDVVNIIVSKQNYYLKKPFVPFDKNLKDKNSDDWFYNHKSKYMKYFPQKPEPKEIDWWWKPADWDSVKEGFKQVDYTPKRFKGISKEKAIYKPHANNKVTFYNNASDDKNGTSGAFRDIYEAIGQAQEFIFIADWSFHAYARLLHSEDSDETTKERENRSIGKILLDWTKDNKDGVAAIHTWDHTNMAAEDARNDNGKADLKKINEDADLPGNLLWRASSVEGIGWSHHQKFVVLDYYDVESKKRGIKAFLGGLDLTMGRFDWHEHPINSGSFSEFKRRTNVDPETDDWYNAEFLEKDDPFDYPRQPWRDIYCCIDGPAAQDILREFTGRWNVDPSFGNTQGDNSEEHITVVQNAFKKTFSDAFIQQWEIPAHKGDFNAQIIRSMQKGHWGSKQDIKTKTQHGDDFKEFQWRFPDQNKETEQSIQDAYLELIGLAEEFIYVETQYFIGSDQHWLFDPSGSNETASNKVPEALLRKILKKARAGKKFHVFLIIPMFPEGSPEDGALQGIRDLQWTTISYVIRTIQTAGFNWKDFITIGFFANWEGLTGEAVQYNDREENVKKNKRYMVYVHSKAMIVDDKYAIIGSANLNERSLNGERDTEIAAVIWNSGNKKQEDIVNFRKEIWKYYLGIENATDPLEEYKKVQLIGTDNYTLLAMGKKEHGGRKKIGYFCTWHLDGTRNDLGIRGVTTRLLIDGYTSTTKGDDYCIWPTGYSLMMSFFGKITASEKIAREWIE